MALDDEKRASEDADSYKTTQPLFTYKASEQPAEESAPRALARPCTEVMFKLDARTRALLEERATGGRASADVRSDTIMSVGTQGAVDTVGSSPPSWLPAHARGTTTPGGWTLGSDGELTRVEVLKTAHAAASEVAQSMVAEIAQSMVAEIAQAVRGRQQQPAAPGAGARVARELDAFAAASQGDAQAKTSDAKTSETPDRGAVSSPAARATPAAMAPAPATQAKPSARVSAQSPLFRAEALAAYRRGERAASVLRITTVSRWSLLAVLGAALAIALAVIALAEVEERSAARGVLRMPNGLSPVVPLISGRVREVLVTPEAPVEAGQVIVRLDTTPIEAQRHEALLKLQAIEEQWRLQERSLRANFERGSALMRSRIALLERRQLGQQQRIARRREHVRRVQAPELDDVLEHQVREQSMEALDGARDDLLRMSDELSSLRLQLSNSRATYEQQLSAGEERVRDARAALESSEQLLDQAVLRAPISGKLESLRVHPGHTVQAGEWIARVVRAGTPRGAVAFVPEREAAFLRVGATARLEIDKLPAGEFGLARAHVERVGGELADAGELDEALGKGALQGPHVRVELKLDDVAETRALEPYLRAGTLVTARIALRDRRLLAIVFEPVRKWLE